MCNTRSSSLQPPFVKVNRDALDHEGLRDSTLIKNEKSNVLARAAQVCASGGDGLPVPVELVEVVDIEEAATCKDIDHWYVRRSQVANIAVTLKAAVRQVLNELQRQRPSRLNLQISASELLAQRRSTAMVEGQTNVTRNFIAIERGSDPILIHETIVAGEVPYFQPVLVFAVADDAHRVWVLCVAELRRQVRVHNLVFLTQRGDVHDEHVALLKVHSKLIRTAHDGGVRDLLPKRSHDRLNLLRHRGPDEVTEHLRTRKAGHAEVAECIHGVQLLGAVQLAARLLSDQFHFPVRNTSAEETACFLLSDNREHATSDAMHARDLVAHAKICGSEKSIEYQRFAHDGLHKAPAGEHEKEGVQMLFNQKRFVVIWVRGDRIARQQKRRDNVVFIDLKCRSDTIDAVSTAGAGTTKEVVIDAAILAAWSESARKAAACCCCNFRADYAQVFGVGERAHNADQHD